MALPSREELSGMSSECLQQYVNVLLFELIRFRIDDESFQQLKQQVKLIREDVGLHETLIEHAVKLQDVVTNELKTPAMDAAVRAAYENVRPKPQSIAAGVAEAKAEVDSPAASVSSSPAIVVAWNPEVVSEEDYADLVNAIGDLVRLNGGAGVELRRTDGLGIACEAGVPQ